MTILFASEYVYYTVGMTLHANRIHTCNSLEWACIKRLSSPNLTGESSLERVGKRLHTFKSRVHCEVGSDFLCSFLIVGGFLVKVKLR